MGAPTLIDFAVATIFARECLEGAIIIGQYRTIIFWGGDALAPGLSQEDALSAVTCAALMATVLALVVIAAIAIPLAVLSTTFDTTTAYIIEGISKIVAAISLLQLSLKLPKFLGIYGSTKKPKLDENEESESPGLTRRSIRFNVAWNIWREVAECGVFLIPFFLAGDDLVAIPLSALVGSFVGILCGFGIYCANKKLRNKFRLCIFAVLLLVFLSAGLFAGGCHKLEVEIGSTKEVYHIEPKFWDVERLPMTILKPFGYDDTRTVLQIVCFWVWLATSALLHIRKYRIAPKISTTESTDDDMPRWASSTESNETEMQELGETTTHASQTTPCEEEDDTLSTGNDVDTIEVVVSSNATSIALDGGITQEATSLSTK